MEVNELAWRKSSYSSGNGGACVEVAPISRGVAVRDSKNPGGPILSCGSDEWHVFIGGMKIGRLGHV
ncbi:DUF397 domain-containing protein [Sphaerisporangium album]|uniref:DUF397 domain-containing protein n=1 Tax=Sphaerisporangium album TaxID=509200 RepID=A0A367FK13_9ACTN|nr:DUF397 domain-containing protein [Sphaerisporangium album]RCG30172.1 DUF397 domain-containing protein [Sphaerisporangium album]